MSGKLVLLTGGTGFLGRHVLTSLLESGVSVRAAVRSAEKGEALKRAYPQFSDNLETVVVPDIEKSDAYDDVVQGADIVIHMASPLPRPGLDNEAGILIPAREGIVNMLKAAKGAPSVQRVVMTSSSVAVMDFSVPRTDTRIWTEEDWNPATWEDGVSGTPGDAYRVSKAYAERAAWEFMGKEKPHFDLIALNPPGVFGPILERPASLAEVTGSTAYLLNVLNPDLKEIPPTWSPLYIDVRDTAVAHVKAAFAPASAGNQRYLLAGPDYGTNEQAHELLIKWYPNEYFAPLSKDAEGELYGQRFDTSKAQKTFGITFRSFEEMYKDLAEFGMSYRK